MTDTWTHVEREVQAENAGSHTFVVQRELLFQVPEMKQTYEWEVNFLTSNINEPDYQLQ